MSNFYAQIAEILHKAKAKAAAAVNFAQVEANWKIGQKIVEEEQGGKHRAEYGKNIIGYLSEKLTNEFGKGYDVSNLSNMRKFYLVFPFFDAVRQELSWTHYRHLIKVQNQQARAFYLKEAIEQQWGTRSLERQINSLSSFLIKQSSV